MLRKPTHSHPAFASRRARLLGGTTLALALVVGTVVAPSSGADELGDKRAQAAQVTAQLDGLTGQVETISEQLEVAKGKIDAAQRALDEAQGRADAARADAERNLRELRAFSVDAYVQGNSDPAMDALFTENSNDAAKVKGYLKATTGNRADMIAQAEGAREAAEHELENLTTRQAELDAVNRELQASKDEAERAVAEQQKIRDGLNAEIKALVDQEAARKAEAEQAATRAAAAAAAAANPRVAAPAVTTSTSGGQASSDSGTPPPVGSGADAAVAAAISRIGLPYVWAAAGPNTFDCSGLTQWAWKHAGVNLDHYTGSQLAQTRRISEADLQPGDLIFFWSGGGDPSHVGLYIGGGTMVHAPGTGRNVKYDSIHYWPSARLAFGRVQ